MSNFGEVPKNAETGSTVMCPECDEVFTPPQLKAKAPKKVVKAQAAYDPEEDEETYKVGRATSDRDEQEKSRRATAAMRAARARERERARPEYRPFFGALEVAVLILAAVAAVAVGVGYVVAKRFPNTGEGIAIVLVYVFGMLMFAGRVALARSRLGDK